MYLHAMAWDRSALPSTVTAGMVVLRNAAAAAVLSDAS
jgi:hypothetical protein